jgi:hypothetical protein
MIFSPPGFGLLRSLKRAEDIASPCGSQPSFSELFQNFKPFSLKERINSPRDGGGKRRRSYILSERQLINNALFVVYIPVIGVHSGHCW